MNWDIDHLLELDGTVQEFGGGYWIKVKATQIQPSAEKPHGIDYSLTLHNPKRERIYGLDNAHPIKKQGRGKVKPFDHVHNGVNIRIYEYESAESLVQEFFEGVERTLKSLGVWS